MANAEKESKSNKELEWILWGVVIAFGVQVIYDAVGNLNEVFKNDYVQLVFGVITVVVLVLIILHVSGRKSNAPKTSLTPKDESNLANVIDKELELEKIKYLKEEHQNYFKIGSSALTVSLSTLLDLIITPYFSQKLDLSSSGWLIIGLGIVISVPFIFIDRLNSKFSRVYGEWVKEIEENRPLPSIPEMEEKLKLFK